MKLSFPKHSITLIIAGLAAPGFAATPVFDVIERIGLTDAEHTRPTNGRQLSTLRRITPDGKVLGSSNRYRADGSLLGNSDWVYVDGGYTRVGLTDTAHSAPSGYRISYPELLNSAGMAGGGARRYVTTWPDSNFPSDRSAWVYDGAVTYQYGLDDADHTSDYLRRTSYVEYLNAAGQAAGTSNMYVNDNEFKDGQSAWFGSGGVTTRIGLYSAEDRNVYGGFDNYVLGMAASGQVVGSGGRTSVSVWVYDAATTTRVGLFDAAHTGVDGRHASYFSAMNTAGAVIGTSYRFIAGTINRSGSRSAWLYAAGELTQLGLLTNLYTGEGGRQISSARAINEAGTVLGDSEKYPGNNNRDAMGTVWLYAGGVTTTLRHPGIEFTRDDGHFNQWASKLSASGKVLGTAYRYNGGADELGRLSWVYDGAAYTSVGLTDTEHTNPATGGYWSNGLFINDAGQAAGWAQRYIEPGSSAWFFDGTATHRLGLTSGVYRRASDGRQASDVTHLGEGGVVVGESDRFGPTGSAYGHTVWVSDGTTTFEARPPGYEGYDSGGNVTYVGDDNFVLGDYVYYDPPGYVQGRRAFVFHPDWGMLFTDDLLSPAAQAAGWAYVTRVVGIATNGDIFAQAYNTSLGAETGVRLRLASLPVPMDLQIWDSGNVIDLGAGTDVTVALISQQRANRNAVDFDATQVDPASLSFGVDGAPVQTNPLWTVDHNGDGVLDAGGSFDPALAGISCTDTELTVTGNLLSGEAFTATDVINPINCDTGSCHP